MPSAAAPIALAALCLIAAGCGELGGDTRPKERAPLVTESELAGYPEGSPAHAFLEWFRALQLGDAKVMARYYVPSLGLSREDLERKRKAGAYAVDPLAPPLIGKVAERGSRAVVTVQFRTGSVTPNGRVDLKEKNIGTFELRREGGRWLLASNSFLDLVARESPGAPPAPAEKGVPKVGRAELARYPEGRPERAFLEWFGALQRRRSAVAVRYYVPELKLTKAKLARVRERAAYAFDGFGRPRILGVTRRGSIAAVRVRLRIYSGTAGDPFPLKEGAPTSFELRLDGGRWRLTGNGLLEVLAARG